MIRPLLVAIDASPALRPKPSGTEVYAGEIIRALAGTNPGHTMRLYANATAAPPWLPRGAEWRSIPFPRLWTQWRFARALSKERPAVVFVPSHVLPVALTVPGVVTIHDVGHRVEHSSYSPAAWWYLELTTRYMARRAARLIAVSRHTALELSRLYGVPSARIAVIPCGVNPAMRPPSQAEVEGVRQRYGLPSRYFVYVGRAHPRKNLPFLVRAFVDARRRGLDAGLALIGPSHPALDVEAVRVLGYVPPADLPALYGGALGLTLPSRYEGFGFPVVEAMRCGTPVLASSAGALPEVVGGAGILLSLRDTAGWSQALLQLASDDALRRRLIEAGFERSEQFTWERAASATWKVLAEATVR